MSTDEHEWLNYFTKVFTAVKRMFNDQFRIDPDEMSPEIVTMKEGFNQLPCPVRILELVIPPDDRTKFDHDTCYLLRYDYATRQTKPIEYLGRAQMQLNQGLRNLIMAKFGENNMEIFDKAFQDLNGFGYGDENLTWWVEFLTYDLRQNFDKFVFEFFIQYQLHLEAISSRKFDRQLKETRVKYQTMFNLQPDPIRTLSEITAQDQLLKALVRWDRGVTRRPTIEDLQRDVCDIHLIPKVPKHTRRVFDHAKSLYIFGYFRYGFFTVANHYAYLALESAIHNKYDLFLGKKVTLMNKNGETYEMATPTRENIFRFCKETKGWNRYHLTVNDENFPVSQDNLLDWLVEHHIIAKWERRRYATGLQLRNIMSHQTFAPVDLPGSRTLQIIADDINRLYFFE